VQVRSREPTIGKNPTMNATMASTAASGTSNARFIASRITDFSVCVTSVE
jgi:hypothetical protein